MMKSCLKFKNEITKEYKTFYINLVNSIWYPSWTVMLKEAHVYNMPFICNLNFEI